MVNVIGDGGLREVVLSDDVTGTICAPLNKIVERSDLNRAKNVPTVNTALCAYLIVASLSLKSVLDH